MAGVMVLLLLVSCRVEFSTEPKPNPADPWFGLEGNVLISDLGHSADPFTDELWVGFDRPADWPR